MNERIRNKPSPSEAALTPFRREQEGTLPNEIKTQLDQLRGIQLHLRDFVDLAKTDELRNAKRLGKDDFVLTVDSTVQALKDMGLDVRAMAALFHPQSLGGAVLGPLAGSLLFLSEQLPVIGTKVKDFDQKFGGYALAQVFITRFKKELQAQHPGEKLDDVNWVPLSRIFAVGVQTRGDKTLTADTGSFRGPNGEVDPEKAAAFFANVALASAPPGKQPEALYVTQQGLEKYYAAGGFPGKVLNALELSLAMDLFGEMRTDGTKVLTAEGWVKFLAGRPMGDRMEAHAQTVKSKEAHRIAPALLDVVVHNEQGLAKVLAEVATKGGLHVNSGTRAVEGAQSVYSPEALAAYDKRYGIDADATAKDQAKGRTLAHQLETAVIKTPAQNLVLHVLGKSSGNLMGCPAMNGSLLQPGAENHLPVVQTLDPKTGGLKNFVFGPDTVPTKDN